MERRGLALLGELEAEHELIERVLGALRTYVRRRLGGSDDRAAGARFVRFFRVFVQGYHHDREEQVLFPALARELEVSATSGPLGAMLGQHHDLAQKFDELAPLLFGPLARPEERSLADDLSRAYAHGLWKHLDAENSVLFPESAARLARVGVYELPSRAARDDERAARDDGEQLVVEFPPVEDATVQRGDGCVLCPSFGVTCRGIEREWWNESEWEDFHARGGD